LPSDASTGLAGALNRTGDWLTTRLNNIDLFDEHHAVEAKTNPFYSIGGIFYLVWFIVMLSGLLLIMWYIPTKAAAFDSILNIQHHIPFGNIVRGMHKYGADAMIIAATIRMYRMFLAADYKPGKEFNIAIALVTLLLSMYSGLTGYLLIWNQRAFWATKVFATFPTYMDQFPFMGDFYLPLVRSVHMGWNTAEFLLGAGGAITQETITRFFSLHLAFSLIPLIFVELYFYRTGYKRIPINWVKRSVVIAMLVIVAVVMPAALGHRSNPDVTPLPILSDWYFLGLYQMYKYLEPVVATEITMVIPLTVVLLPFLDVWITGPEKDIKKRPLVFMVALMGFLNWIIFSILIVVNIANIHNDPPYWRDFLWGLVDIGVLMQLAIYFFEKDPRVKAKYALGCIVMGVTMVIESALAFIYYFMASTEMFLSPLTQAWTYGFFKMLGQIPNADRLETIVRTLSTSKTTPAFWYYRDLLPRHAGIPAPDLPMVQEMDKLTNASNPLVDWIFKLIPTFQTDTAAVLTRMKQNNVDPSLLDDVLKQPWHYPNLHTLDIPAMTYKGIADFMISNRWTFDFVTFVDRMNPDLHIPSANSVGGEVLKYPLPMTLMVPGTWTVLIDWGWMLMAPACAIACFWMYFKLKSEAAAIAPPAVAKTTVETTK
jgi:quinol-cytochrome oxidoreductase complex cytochrome b subunit